MIRPALLLSAGALFAAEARASCDLERPVEEVIACLDAALSAAEATIAELESAQASTDSFLSIIDSNMSGVASSQSLITNLLSQQAYQISGLVDEDARLADQQGNIITTMIANEGAIAAIQGDYLTAASLAGYATEAWVGEQGYGAGVEGLADYLVVDTATDSVVFSGANVYVRSGGGATDAAVNGLGNLIVGYGTDEGTSDDRTGSHNLVIGDDHAWSSYAGLVAGYANTLSGPYASVTGGWANTASGQRASVSGGGTWHQSTVSFPKSASTRTESSPASSK